MVEIYQKYKNMKKTRREELFVFLAEYLKEGCTFKKGCTFWKRSANHHQIQGSIYKDNNERSKLYQPLSSRRSWHIIYFFTSSIPAHFVTKMYHSPIQLNCRFWFCVGDRCGLVGLASHRSGLLGFSDHWRVAGARALSLARHHSSRCHWSRRASRRELRG